MFLCKNKQVTTTNLVEYITLYIYLAFSAETVQASAKTPWLEAKKLSSVTLILN